MFRSTSTDLNATPCQFSQCQIRAVLLEEVNITLVLKLKGALMGAENIAVAIAVKSQNTTILRGQ